MALEISRDDKKIYAHHWINQDEIESVTSKLHRISIKERESKGCVPLRVEINMPLKRTQNARPLHKLAHSRRKQFFF